GEGGRKVQRQMLGRRRFAPVKAEKTKLRSIAFAGRVMHRSMKNSRKKFSTNFHFLEYLLMESRRTMVAEMAHILLTDASEIPEVSEEQPADYFALLVAQVRAGDGLAFERIMLATEQRVVSIAWRMLGNRDDAREAAQEVYLRVFRYLSQF